MRTPDEEHATWLAERLRRHRGNADVVRQAWAMKRTRAAELGIVVSLRTVERAVSHLRREFAAEALATVRFETPPGRRLQIDFGQRRIAIEGKGPGKVFLFVATPGYSRRVYAAAFRHEWQSAWLEGIEGTFRHFGGLPDEPLLDAHTLVKHHDAATREVEFTDRLHAFVRYWDVRPIACAPYRARTKGQEERGVGYVKHNAIAGRSFASWGALEAHLAWWMREVADTRMHGTTGEAPMLCRKPRRCPATKAMMRTGCVKRWPNAASPPASRQEPTARHRSRTTARSTASATRSRSCSAGSRTGAVSTPATTAAPTPSCPPSASPQPSSSGLTSPEPGC